jgi:hypothetical protein
MPFYPPYLKRMANLMSAEKGGMCRQIKRIPLGLRSDSPIIDMLMPAGGDCFRMNLLPNDFRSVAITATEARDGQTVGMWGWLFRLVVKQISSAHVATRKGLV